MSFETATTRTYDTNTLLGHLATRFQTHPENLATEALVYILKRSVNAADAMSAFLNRTGAKLSTRLTYASQVSGEDGAIPDLVARDEHFATAFIVEAKFWAGLTDSQPVTYLARLPPEKPATLVFVVPSLRLTYLWGELVGRCRTAGLVPGDEINVSPEIKACRVSNQHGLVCTSWRELLVALSSSVLSHDPVTSDLDQLKGFAARMDEDAFAPLRSEELTSNVPDRVRQYCQLVDDIAVKMIADGMATSAGKRSSSTAAAYYQPIVIKGNLCYLQFNCRFWATLRPTPIWLSVETTTSKNPAASSALPRCLAPLMTGSRPKAIDGANGFLIPIELLTGTERHAVLEDAVRQLRIIVNLLELIE